MLEAKVRLVNPLGLHARAAAKLVRCASGFRSRSSIALFGKEADAKSILDVLSLAAPCGSELAITVDGEDEGPAFDELRRLIESGFGEI